VDAGILPVSSGFIFRARPSDGTHRAVNEADAPMYVLRHRAQEPASPTFGRSGALVSRIATLPDPSPRVARGHAAASAADSRARLHEALAIAEALPLIPLGEMLLEHGLLSVEQLDVALQLQRRSPDRHLGEVLVELGVISRSQLAQMLARKLGIAFVELAKFDVDPVALKAVPEDLVRAHHFLPLCYDAGRLVVAVADPLDETLLATVRFRTDCAVIAVLATADDIERAVVAYYGRPAAQFEAQKIAEQLGCEMQESDKPEMLIRETDSTLVRLVNKIIIDAHSSGASDIHIESNPGRGSVLVRFRNDGELCEYLKLPYNFRSALISRVKIMADIDISEHRQAQDGRINFRRFGPLDLELRVVTYPTRDGLEDVVMRLLTMKEPLPLEKLGLRDSVAEGLRELIVKPYGLLLAVGPTGSGKTTTLHSLISAINKPGRKILTAENPVEITQPGLRQVQVNEKSGWNFATIMRAFLRADPDVIMVGEMRDRETAGIAVEASLTGHLVFSTLHTNSAAETVVRLLDMGIDPFSFTDSLLGVLGQRLARKLCTACRTSRVASATEVAALAQEYCHGTELAPSAITAEWLSRFGPDLLIHEASGCETCAQRGYKGRAGLFELFTVTPEIRKTMLLRASASELQAMAIRNGMRTMKQDGIEKALQGIMDMREVRATA